jgi:hypothetical protein
MRRSLFPVSLSALALVLGAGAPARAAGPAANSAPLVELTEAGSVLYNFDNRDTRPGQVASVANDNWGMLYNRLNLQVTSGRLTLSLRADSAWFYDSPTPRSIADDLLATTSFASDAERQQFFRQKLTEAGIELSNRFINWTYPAKYALSYGTPDLELTVGDSYAQLGRGLVLSLRKLDELSSDTTLRGLRAGARFKSGGLRVKLTLLGGSTNPLRIDEASGRYLGVSSSVTPSFVKLTEAGMPRAISTDFVREDGDCARFGTCSYAPDRLLAGQAEFAFGLATLGTQFSVLFREPPLALDAVRTASQVTTLSQSLELVNIARHGGFYLEAATQKLSHRESDPTSIPQGYALYGTASWVTSKVSLLAEGKHYRRFFPLTANISTARAREFSGVQYSAPPTTEEIWNDTQFGSFNTCVSGGRVKAEVHVTGSTSTSAWVGRYVSSAESESNDRCESGARENRVWDLGVGLEARPVARPARWLITTGARFDDTDQSFAVNGGSSNAYYRELFTRYQISEPLGGPFTLELQGVHRRRREPVGGPIDAWFEGQHSTGIDWGQRLSAAIGVEYDTRPDVPHRYLNAMLSYRPSSALGFALFAGQRRGALRCVGGVCRIYPPFEGVRLDATFRY